MVLIFFHHGWLEVAVDRLTVVPFNGPEKIPVNSNSLVYYQKASQLFQVDFLFISKKMGTILKNHRKI